MNWVGWAVIVWCAVSVVVALGLGRVIRYREQGRPPGRVRPPEHVGMER
jgi:hypothetical protein